jgi:hypothetical protein
MLILFLLEMKYDNHQLHLHHLKYLHLHLLHQLLLNNQNFVLNFEFHPATFLV